MNEQKLKQFTAFYYEPLCLFGIPYLEQPDRAICNMCDTWQTVYFHNLIVKLLACDQSYAVVTG